MRHVSRTHRVALDWLFDRINLDPKIQIKYIDTKNQLADIPPKGNFTRDKWNHLLCLFNISRFSSTDCSEVMSKRTQKDSGEDRVTAKSRPMMNLGSRCSERTPDVLPSTASESLGKTRYESQLPLSSWNADKPMMSLIARVPSNVSSSTSVCPEKRSFGNQNPWSTNTEKEERLGRPVVDSDQKTASDFYLVFLRGPTIWKVMSRNVWNDIVS